MERDRGRWRDGLRGREIDRQADRQLGKKVGIE